MYVELVHFYGLIKNHFQKIELDPNQWKELYQLLNQDQCQDQSQGQKEN
jgi:hypothetical protein